MEDPMAIDKKLIDKLLIEGKKPEDIIGRKRSAQTADQAILERALRRR